MKNQRQRIGLLVGSVLFFLLLALPLPANMPPLAMKVAAVMLLMGTWWICETIPLAATALLPIVLFPVLGIMPANKVTTIYANHIIFLFLGGFLIAIAIERWHLHKRIALQVLRFVGTRPDRVVLGFMFVTAFLSSWISNTAATLMMVTIGTAVLSRLVQDDAPLLAAGKGSIGVVLMLSIGYASSIGGIATLIGSPPNAILAGIMEADYGLRIGFFEWMLFALPLSLVMLGIAWLYLTRIAYRLDGMPELGGKSFIDEELRGMGPISSPELRVMVVFVSVASAWVLRGLVDNQLLNTLGDSTIAICGALALFIIPSGRERGEALLDWENAVRVPWDILILFGGGLALASGIADSGLSTWLGMQLGGLAGLSLVVLIGVLVLLVVFLTEVSSNTATASLLLPIAGGFAIAAEIPALTLMAPVALAASFAFMLPVATPPNAIVFGTRQVSIPQMASAGFWLNLIGTVLITVFVLWLLPLVWSPAA